MSLVQCRRALIHHIITGACFDNPSNGGDASTSHRPELATCQAVSQGYPSAADVAKAVLNVVLNVAPSRNARRTSSANSGAERPRNPKSLRAAEVQSPAQSEDIDMSALVPLTTENRKISNLYDPNLFPEHRGDWFRAQQQRQDHTARHSQRTLFCAALSLKTYVWPESKTYHMYIERLKILDQGSGDPWSYPIPSAFPSTLSKKCTRHLEPVVDADVNDDFKAFQSPSKKSRA
ncbi:hypothetical protein B0H14DRAFT_2570483 [Mycena olivaceomarginata]|nr:hypothetical protein B0H14DRAFT_2570483 [Mycena olivaceomarginata]